ncbi:hypothetical protein BX257_1460 [Streptomyces sp. 3212.3]|nr:hypothetical protein BX257_1460 [Streptomyces sp. 3212.3]
MSPSPTAATSAATGSGRNNEATPSALPRWTAGPGRRRDLASLPSVLPCEEPPLPTADVLTVETSSGLVHATADLRCSDADVG